MSSSASAAFAASTQSSLHPRSQRRPAGQGAHPPADRRRSEPRHGPALTGEPMALAGLAAGADGVIVEVHPTPDRAKCDANQTITPDVLARIKRKGMALHAALADVFEPVIATAAD